jgi:hypothetical protein
MSSFWNLFGSKQEQEEEPKIEQTGPIEPVAQELAIAPEPIPPAKIPPALPPPKPALKYGIDDAIKLMRTLPLEVNVELVVRVMKKTLESLDVQVVDIIEDAERRQDALRGKIAEYKGHIADFQREIEARRSEIARLEGDLAETTVVRERLTMTESIGETPAAPAVEPPPIAPPRPPLPAGASRPPPDRVFQPSPLSRGVPTYRVKHASQPQITAENGPRGNPSAAPPEKKPSVPPLPLRATEEPDAAEKS